MQEYEYMKLALSLARAAEGQTSPNPLVGAVVVKNGNILGMGAHLRAGTPHAEVHAIRAAGVEASGSDLYVTLEPCSHHGKTPPCTELIIEAGIKRVIVATQDPNPLVAGKGIERLRSAGIEVEVGLCKGEADNMNKPFFHFIKTRQPFVTLKAGLSLDGKTAASSGDSKWITSSEARLDVHELRHKHDAILVGINTVLTDDPLLTTRLPRGGKNPNRIILDTQLRTPLNARIVEDRSAKTIIITGENIDTQKKYALKQKGVEVISLSSKTISLQDVLFELGKKNIMSLLVEGGGEVHASFIKEQVYQQIIFYVAPLLIGGKQSFPVIGGNGATVMKEAEKLTFISIEKIGSDLKITAIPREKDSDV
ncbi:bifunctional diaminohydroxyphosphoribosylaminopyrimidine deaminase/5-amino-6-(5-phosphoribosylamino)uracil reductase RibD [Bacillus aquiflavi]|uniref:Riboflavin biosynthesis protein RibD n=1 Tax=Bacillus aquiflavi TaxID=2672567 RepID=A0A6B3VVU3_9BACI|nr:bifunctional diaminohydroxyphosphoribosylaminopyrimidine deaminase/5-amino-6-(5-phosphoribosylamino)uracil reductase RibD [Bacillus aquiflavi]MBA4536755.1 bifunctional diaminohydroxyphosphoribosylaminopyrimidine deaminase/5-amino-6-(5-phosphoribosylamino)uracil reductase RibD [Bacillus aquiflavi]NEY81122.1 bifunctional diaminohydroxyphosphoribosylaminopyrimidine deaminase/5-amino-6-(5-phosphoribosylamino)uracil reductase RibD [Bacillus aquiflavi]UAC49686.1 bifunctional diaminohydroxyphosphori